MSAEILERLEAHRMHCTAAEYHAHEALSCSQFLSAGLYTETEEFWTPHKFGATVDPSEDMDRGTLTHAAYYEPESFGSLYAVRPLTAKGRLVACDTKEFAEWSAMHPNKIHVHPSDMTDINGMAKALESERESGCLTEYFRATHILSTERSYVVDGPHGLRLRIKPDRLRIRRSDGILICEDLKTSKDISPREFRRVCRYGLQYYRRAAFYRLAIRLITGEDCIFRMIAVESVAPYLVALYQVSSADIDEAARQNEESLMALARCIDSGSFRPAWLKGCYEL